MCKTSSCQLCATEWALHQLRQEEFFQENCLCVQLMIVVSFCRWKLRLIWRVLESMESMRWKWVNDAARQFEFSSPFFFSGCFAWSTSRRHSWDTCVCGCKGDMIIDRSVSRIVFLSFFFFFLIPLSGVSCLHFDCDAFGQNCWNWNVEQGYWSC